METTTTPAPENTAKKTVVRSASYPAYTIKQSKEFVTEIYRLNPSPNSVITLASITGVIPSGAMDSEFACAKAYGFLEKIPEGDGYKISPLFKKLYAPIGNDEKDGLLQAFKNPKLYQELIEKYDGFALPKELPVILFRFHRIAENKAEKAAEIFITNAVDAGVLDGNLILNTSSQIIVEAKIPEQLLTNLNNDKSETNGSNQKPPINTNSEGQVITETEKANALALAEMNNAETEKVIIPGSRFISVTYPKNLTQSDLKTFEKWYEYFKLRFGE